MENKHILNSSVVALATLGAATSMAEAPSQDPRYARLKDLMREYVQQVVIEECSAQEEFDFDSYRWSDYEIKGLEVVLFDILNHTSNYCKPPELTGMHSADALTGSRIK